ncbi:MAG: enolase C-terminal domain-like protein [Chloroflexota bacterium]|nr:enolase C-terminal domain-like protein [Chloroflexota bacterium]
MISVARIQSVTAREVFSDRGHPGIQAVVTTQGGQRGAANVTAGLSVGKHEVKFAYDGGKRWEGLGVGKAVKAVVEVIGPAIVGLDATRQREVDEVMIALDGTPDKSKLGGNATASVSAAVLKAGAASLGVPLYQHIGGVNACVLPVPCAGAFGGCGRYGGGPPGSSTGDKPSHSFVCYGFDTFSDAAYAGWEVSRRFRRVIQQRFKVGSESSGYSGIAPGMVSHDRHLWEAMADAIEKAGYAGRVGIQIDVAAGTYFDEGRGVFTGLFSRGDKTKEELFETYREMVVTYPVVILEDPLGEEDYQGHAELTRELGIEIVGDDLFTTNPARLQQGIDVGGANCMLLKVNQVGTITEAFDAVQMAYRAGYGVMPCMSRGEGDALADYVVGLGTAHTREGVGGSIGNRYLEIEAELGSAARFLGKRALKVRWPERA